MLVILDDSIDSTTDSQSVTTDDLLVKPSHGIHNIEDDFNDTNSVVFLTDSDIQIDDDQFEVWDKTVLGKAYQQERKNKRDRKQPYDLSAISTGIPTDRQTLSYRYLETKSIPEVALLEKPEFMLHPEKFFLKKEDEVIENEPLTVDELKLRHDEKTIFPKHVIDKMKQSGRSALNRPSVFARLANINRGLSSLSTSTTTQKKEGWAGIIREVMTQKISEE